MTDTLPIVGRDRQLADLQRRVALAAQGHGGVCLLSGEAGIGKTALLRRVLEMSRGTRSAVGTAVGRAETPPFGPWRELAVDMAGGGDSPLETLPAPLGRAPSATDIADIACALLRKLDAEGPLLLGLEDVQWADSGSMDLLRVLAPHLLRRRVLLLVTYRSDEVDPDHPLWLTLPDLRRAGAVDVRLGPLPPQAVFDLADALLPGRPDISGVAADVHRRSGGNPLFVRELLAAHDPGRRLLPGATPLPDSVRQAVAARVRRWWECRNRCCGRS